jgi:hypothetical protein
LESNVIVLVHVGIVVVKSNWASRPAELAHIARLTNNLSPMMINATVFASPEPKDEKVV